MLNSAYILRVVSLVGGRLQILINYVTLIGRLLLVPLEVRIGFRVIDERVLLQLLRALTRGTDNGAHSVQDLRLRLILVQLLGLPRSILTLLRHRSIWCLGNSANIVLEVDTHQRYF